MKIQQYFRNLFPKKDILFTNSGRAALQAIIEDFNLQNSKMILPSFICSDVFSPLLIQNNIEPILIDCPKDEFNIRVQDIEKSFKKNSEVKSVLIVHTFGNINKNSEKIKKWCAKNNLVLIEDCAHCVGTKHCGNFGDAVIFSFPKIFNVFLGGCYVKKKGKIKIKPGKYVISRLDFYKFLNQYWIGRSLIKLIKKNRKPSIKVNPDQIKILELPKLILGFSKNWDVQKKFVSLLVENRDNVFEKLVECNIKCNKMWANPLSLDENLLAKYKLKKCVNSEDFSRRILNIVIENNISNREINKRLGMVEKIIEDSKNEKENFGH